MSEVTANTENKSDDAHNFTQLHKTVSVSSKNWVSPFRTSGSIKRNPSAKSSDPVTPKKDVKAEAPSTENEILNAASIDTPKDSALPVEQTEAPEVTQEENEEEPLEEPAVTEVSEIDEEEEPLDQQVVAAESEPTPATSAEEPVVEEIPSAVQSKPKLLKRYKENFNITSQIMNKNKIQNVSRKVDLGAGLVLTEDQIYELARKKLQPVMKQIDDRVAQDNARDAKIAAKVEADIKAKDEAVVAKDLAAYKAEVDAKTDAFKEEHDQRIKELEEKSEKSKEDTERYIEEQTAAIVQDKEDSEKAESDAAEAHIKNKEDLIANAGQLKIDKTSELENAKTKQVEESDLIEKLKKNTEEHQAKQIDLKSQLDAKKAELEEKIKKVEALIALKHEKQEITRSSLKRKKVADRSFGIINAKHAQAASNIAVLTTQVGLMTDRLGAHSTKINHFKTTGKEELVNKRVEASKASDEWANHLASVRLEEAKRQEQIRIAAEEERKRVEQEKAEEEERLAKEKEEEEARIAQEKEEEEARIAKEKEEEEARKAKEIEDEKARIAKEKEDARIAAEKKKQEEEKEAARIAEEIERLKKLKQLNAEKLELENSLQAQAKATDAKKKDEDQSKSHSSSGLLGGVLGGIGGAVVGTAVTGAAVASSGAAASGSAISNGTKFVSKAAEPSYAEELSKSSVGKSSDTSNPFYVGDFDDKGDLPSTIHEHEDEEPEQPHAKHHSHDETHENATITDDLPEEIPESELPETEIETQHAEKQHLANSVAEPGVKRRSMVDEAIAHMTPEQIQRMNMPLSQQIKNVPAATDKSKKSVPSTSRNNSLTNKSRSNSLTSKFSFKKNNKSRSNSLSKPSGNKASNTQPLKSKTISAPVLKSSSNPAVNSAVAAGTTPTGVPASADADDDDDDYSELEPPKVDNPVFTEKIGKSPTPTNGVATEEHASENKPVADDPSNYVEVETLETVSSAEYHEHKADPNYMVVDH